MLKMELNEREQAGRRSEEERGKDNKSSPAGSDNSPTKGAEHSTQAQFLPNEMVPESCASQERTLDTEIFFIYMPLPRILWGF